MSLPPNRVKVNRVWVVRHRNRPNLDWRVLAKSAASGKEKAEKAHESGPWQQDADEAKSAAASGSNKAELCQQRVVLADEPRLAYERLTAEEAR